MKLWLVAAALVTGGLLAGCGGQAGVWSLPVELPVEAFGLGPSVALVDRPAQRVVLLTPGPDQRLDIGSMATGHNIINAVASPDQKRLFVVSAGHRAGLGDAQPDESPSLTIIEPGATPPLQRIDLDFLTDPLSGLALDPGGHWAVLYAGGDSGGNGALVENPNELVILDVSLGSTAAPVVHTLQSFGGKPVRLTFTALLQLPVGARHLLLVESDQDLSILQLEYPAMPEITVPFTTGDDTRSLGPAGLTVDDGEPDRDDDARIGVRLGNDSSVATLQLVPASGGNGFLPAVNLSDVGGVPSDIAFVRTDGGLRLAALVPSQTQAVLIDPTTGLTTAVALPAPYQSLSLVTGAAGGAGAGASAGIDVALLWNGGVASGGVAFWELGQTTGQPYRSVETVDVAASVAEIFDVPAPEPNLKVLQTAAADAFYVLDLATRTAAPLLTSTSAISLRVSPLGDQVFTFVANTAQVAATDLATKHPRSLLVERPVQDLFELARADGGRSVVVLHAEGDVGATVFDATTEDDATRRLYAGLLIDGSLP